VLISALGNVAAEVAAEGFGSPAVVIVGEVVRLRDQLAALEPWARRDLALGDLVPQVRGNAA
jgi:hypothetical protein